MKVMTTKAGITLNPPITINAIETTVQREKIVNQINTLVCI